MKIIEIEIFIEKLHHQIVFAKKIKKNNYIYLFILDNKIFKLIN
jgi:hypothetical protein